MKKVLPLIFLCYWCITNVSAQENNVQLDSLSDIVAGERIEVKKTGEFFIPKKAAMFSAAFPGLGQLYNHKWWKVPILYAGFAACAYGINYNNERYLVYRNAYIDLVDSDPASKRYIYTPIRGTLEEREAIILANKSGYETIFEKRKDSYRRDRDLMILVTIGVYVLNIIDANVDAHLSDFDVSNDLSMNITPVLLGDYSGTGKSNVGLSLKINF